MVIAKRDWELLRTKEVCDLMSAYAQKHGEMFVPFNYGDFRGTKDKTAVQVYIEVLKTAIESDVPYRIASHRYDDFDH